MHLIVYRDMYSVPTWYAWSYPHRVLQSLIMEPESVHVVHQALEAIPLSLLEHLTEDPNQEVDIQLEPFYWTSIYRYLHIPVQGFLGRGGALDPWKSRNLMCNCCHLCVLVVEFYLLPLTIFVKETVSFPPLKSGDLTNQAPVYQMRWDQLTVVTPFLFLLCRSVTLLWS